MCGYLGFVNVHSQDIEIDFIKKLTSSLRKITHRGPDSSNHIVKDNIFLGHNRLSILDVSDAGIQPMVSDGVYIVINGEIYNFQSLKRELGEEKFFSCSDSEVILHGYKAWGIDILLSKIEGMFSGCIYDSINKKIYIFRDRVGIKPLYWSDLNEQFIFSSELKSIESVHGDMKIDNQALFDFLNYRYIPAPKTAYQGCYKLEAGSYLMYDLELNSHKICKYWELKVKPFKGAKIDAELAVEKALNESINSQMVSDVPVGFFLSGGIDSSLVVKCASALGIRKSCYTIQFEKEEASEVPFAKKVAQNAQVKLNVKEQRRLTAVEIENFMLEKFDLPFGDTSAVPTFLVSKSAKEDVTVILTGDGGDELFGGYKWYKQYQLIMKWRRIIRIPNFLCKLISFYSEKWDKKLIYLSSSDNMEIYSVLRGGLTLNEQKEWKKTLNIPKGYDSYWYYRKFYDPSIGEMKSLQYIDFNTYLPEDILYKVDTMSMLNSIECRVPFLDTKLIELAFSMPENWLYDGGLKGLLKKISSKYLPEEIINREKQGFSLPNKKWRDKGVEKFQIRLLKRFLKFTEYKK